jgi:hypothetical protein
VGLFHKNRQQLKRFKDFDFARIIFFDKLKGVFHVLIYASKNKKMKEDTFSNKNTDIENKDNSIKNPSDPSSDYPAGLTQEQQQRQNNYRIKLSKVKDFNETFELVKSAVDAKFKMHRAGLSLVLQVLPTQLGAYHILGSNMIIMNKRILDIIKLRKSLLEYNAYLFMVLCHEYFHSFGIIDEKQVRIMTYDLCQSLLGDDHPSSLMAKYEPWKVFPELQLYQTNKFENRFEIITNFDKTTQSYIN